MVQGLFVFLLGISFGSFINVLVFRLHEGIKLRGRSKCLTCEVPIENKDLIPVVSFFLLKKRCRSCKVAFSWQYPIIEFVTGCLFLFLFLRYTQGFFVPELITAQNYWGFLIRDLVFTLFLIVLFVYDLKYYLILDKFTVPAMVIAILFNVSLGMSPITILLGGLTIGGFFLLQFLVSKGEWVGGGDIRMGIMMGFMLGLVHGLVALFIAYLLGAAVGVVLIALKKVKRKSMVPFGTFLALGTFISMIWGTALLDWYLGLFL